MATFVVFIWSVIKQFENQTQKCPKRQMFGYRVFGIQMVTVFTIQENFSLNTKI